jgi:hypothetical protein
MAHVLRQIPCAKSVSEAQAQCRQVALQCGQFAHHYAARRLADHLHGELTARVPLLCGDGFQVIRRANDTPYGLAAAVFSKDLDSVNTISRGLKAGSVWVNCYNIGDNAGPFGGYKQSGVGREKGEYGLQHYTQVLCTATVLEGAGVTEWKPPRGSRTTI